MDKLFLGLEKDFYSIGEVSQITGVPSYTLRYWESEFGALRPVRRESRHRKYTRKDVEKIQKIQELLYKKKYTIEGAKKALLRDEKDKSQQLNLDIGRQLAASSALKDLKKEIEEVLDKLQK